nr:immunoglobulin heavy chain junction region [Mus musculus]MBK4188069.1 immunoglobulin heavy chain junction region [Mus musculus]
CIRWGSPYWYFDVW